jgi:hypothetical protein
MGVESWRIFGNIQWLATMSKFYFCSMDLATLDVDFYGELGMWGQSGDKEFKVKQIVTDDRFGKNGCK